MASMESQEGLGEEETLKLHDPNYDYYSIDNILEEEFLLKVKPLTSILQAKCLRGCDEDGVISTETDIELPAWIAIPLIRNNLVQLSEPNEYKNSFL